MSLIDPVNRFEDLKKLFDKNKTLCDQHGVHVLAVEHMIDLMNKLSENNKVLTKLVSSAKEEKELNDTFVMATLMNQLISFSSAHLVNLNKELTVLFHTLNDKMISNIDQQKVDLSPEPESSTVETEVATEPSKPRTKRGGKKDAALKEAVSDQPDTETKPKTVRKKKTEPIVETVIEDVKEVQEVKEAKPKTARKKKTEPVVETVTDKVKDVKEIPEAKPKTVRKKKTDK